MPLNIRNPRAITLARELAVRKGQTMTKVIITALEHELARDKNTKPLAERLYALGYELKGLAKKPRQKFVKAERDALWE